MQLLLEVDIPKSDNLFLGAWRNSAYSDCPPSVLWSCKTNGLRVTIPYNQRTINKIRIFSLVKKIYSNSKTSLICILKLSQWSDGDQSDSKYKERLIMTHGINYSKAPLISYLKIYKTKTKKNIVLLIFETR